MSSQQIDQGPRLIIDSDNKAALVVIVTAIALSWTLLTLIIRVVSKLHIHRSIGVEEAAVIAASLVAGVSSACVFSAIKYGLGTRSENISEAKKTTILKLLWLSEIFYVIALSLAKIAAIPLLVQLTRMKLFIIVCYTLAFFTGLWGFVSAVTIGPRCHLGHPWLDISNQKCSSLYGRWIGIESFSLLIESLIFGLFLHIVILLKMRIMTKIKVILAFSTRLPIIIPTVFRLVYLREGLTVIGDTTFLLVNAIIATQVVLHYTTMAASFAYLKPFLRAFDSNLGATVKVDTVVSNGYAENTRSEQTHNETEETGASPLKRYALRKLQKNRESQSAPSESNPFESRPQSQHLLSTITTSIKSGSTPATRPNSQDHKGLQFKKFTSRESITPMVTPIITKTQEWHIATEVRHEN